MVKELVHDPFRLGVKSQSASQEDRQTAADLLDTLKAHSSTCVGMAANMIGVCKRIIAVNLGGAYVVMYNPVILKQDGEYQTEEGCLSLLGGPRKTKRYMNIKVRYQDELMRLTVKDFNGFAAQMIQHEIDHCNGVLI